MIKITNSERKSLERVGLLKHKKTGFRTSDPNFYVANKEHTGRNKHTYIVETPEVMKFLGYYDGMNLQRINEKQFELLYENGYVNDKNIQKWGEYNPKAICYENAFGEYRVIKITSIMLFLGLWKDNKRKKMAKAQYKDEQENWEEPISHGEVYLGENKPDISEQAKTLGNPMVIFRDVDTGEVVKAGGPELLTGIGLNLNDMTKADGSAFTFN